MADPEPLDEHVRGRMRRQPSRDTKPELELRRQLHALGLRYRLDKPIVPGHPRRRVDIVFGPSRVAVFVDGCFWHQCPKHGAEPKNNQTWWTTKLQRNVERDVETNALLIEGGWRVVRVWEHQDMAEAAIRIRDLVEARR